MADLAALQALLAQAEDAYHRRLTGRKPLTVREPSGKMVVYADTPASQIATYIGLLRAEIDALTGAPARLPRQALLIRF